MTPSRTGPGVAERPTAATSARARLGNVHAESGQMMVLLIGLVGLILMVLGSGGTRRTGFLGTGR
jgi:hypothetical protein